MDDKKIDELMAIYKQRLGHYTGPRVRVRRPIALWKPLSLTGIGLVVTTFVILSPRRAEAAAGEKVLVALNKAGYWRQITSTRKLVDSKWDQSSEITYLDGTVRSVSGFPSAHQLISILDGQSEFEDFRQLPYIIKTKTDLTSLKGVFENPMDYATRYFKSIKTFQKREANPYRGVEAYELYSKGADTQHGVIVTVSKSTNLPLLVHSVGHGGQTRFEVKQEYFYNIPVPRPVITPDPSKPIIDIEADRRKTILECSKVDLNDSKPIVFDGVLGKNGEVWAILGVKSLSNPCWVPNTAQAGYQLATVFPMSQFGRTKDYYVRGHELVAFLYVPISKDIGMPSSVDFDFSRQPIFGKKEQTSRSTNVRLSLHKSKWSFPELMPAFAIDVPVDFIESRFWNTRGHSFLARKEFREAAKCFENEFETSVRFSLMPKSNYSNPLEAAATCYDKLGDHNKANSLRKRLYEMTPQKIFEMRRQ